MKMQEAAAHIINFCSTCGITTFGVGALLTIGVALGWPMGIWTGRKMKSRDYKKWRKDILQ